MQAPCPRALCSSHPTALVGVLALGWLAWVKLAWVKLALGWLAWVKLALGWLALSWLAWVKLALGWLAWVTRPQKNTCR